MSFEKYVYEIFGSTHHGIHDARTAETVEAIAKYRARQVSVESLYREANLEDNAEVIGAILTNGIRPIEETDRAFLNNIKNHNYRNLVKLFDYIDKAKNGRWIKAEKYFLKYYLAKSSNNRRLDITQERSADIFSVMTDEECKELLKYIGHSPNKEMYVRAISKRLDLEGITKESAIAALSQYTERTGRVDHDGLTYKCMFAHVFLNVDVKEAIEEVIQTTLLNSIVATANQTSASNAIVQCGKVRTELTVLETLISTMDFVEDSVEYVRGQVPFVSAGEREAIKSARRLRILHNISTNPKVVEALTKLHSALPNSSLTGGHCYEILGTTTHRVVESLPDYANLLSGSNYSVFKAASASPEEKTKLDEVINSWADVGYIVCIRDRQLADKKSWCKQMLVYLNNDFSGIREAPVLSNPGSAAIELYRLLAIAKSGKLGKAIADGIPKTIETLKKGIDNSTEQAVEMIERMSEQDAASPNTRRASGSLRSIEQTMNSVIERTSQILPKLYALNLIFNNSRSKDIEAAVQKYGMADAALECYHYYKFYCRAKKASLELKK
jgi:hypothetical protein